MAEAALKQGQPAKADTKPLPFDAEKLDALLDAAGIDVLVATSKHNIQYLLGGYRFFFFDYMDAIGPSRYLPVFIYEKGRPEDSAYLGHPMEAYERENGRFWVANVEPSVRGTLDAMQRTVDRLAGLGKRRIGVERPFLPADAEEALRRGMPGSTILDATKALERLRAVKSPEELDLLRTASERVVESMQAVISSYGPGATKRELAEALRRQEVDRGLTFEYCLITAGTSLNRAPSDQRWEEGDILSLDSGGNYHGYIGDLCRMAILGSPDAELTDLLGEVDAIQQATRRPIRAGATGTDIYASAQDVLAKTANGNSIEFVAHGMGLVSHESPRLTYTREDMDQPLQTGMVLSIETTMHHPRRGFVKLEDTVAVTETGWEAFGDSGRGWNRGGTARAA